MSTPYREGNGPDTPEQSKTGPDTPEQAKLDNIYDQFKRSAEGKAPPPKVDPKDAKKQQMPGKDDPVFTAVLLVMTMDGRVLPITNISEVVLMHHAATPHEILRMCADAQDQISSVRIIGEILTNVQKMNTGLAKQVMQIVKSAGLPIPGGSRGE